MFQIIKNGEAIEVQEKLHWVKDQKNGVLISCEEKDGQGILSADQSVIYSVIGKPQLREFEFVGVEEVKWYSVTDQQRADIDYLAIIAEVEL